MKDIIFYKTLDNKTPFLDWYNKLDKSQKIFVDKRLSKLERGLYGENKRLSEELWELKFINGLRIYYIEESEKFIILMSGGNKSRQNKDIERAKQYIEEYAKRV